MLAIHGGQPVRNTSWPVWPPRSEEAEKELTEVLESHRWTIRGWYTGRKSKQVDFAERFARFNQAKHCVMAASGSASLIVALEACDIGFGDEVIVPAYTWIATAIAVVNVNAVPVFVDVDPKTGCIDPRAVEAAITTRTRAVIPVHLHSCIADMDAIKALAEKYHLYVIEDCAQAHGARLGDRYVGTLGHVGCFSMNQEKVLCGGEGGAIITDNDEMADRLGRLRADGSRAVPDAPIPGRYELVDTGGLMGANYCMSDFQAGVLIAELKHLEERNRRRERNAQYLNEQLSSLGGLMPIESTPGSRARTYFKYAIRYDLEAFEKVSISRLCKALSAELGFVIEQTECQPLHRSPLYCPATKRRHHLGLAYLQQLEVTNLHFPSAEAHYDTSLTFHHRILLGREQDMDDIVEAFAKVQHYAGDLATKV